MRALELGQALLEAARDLLATVQRVVAFLFLEKVGFFWVFSRDWCLGLIRRALERKRKENAGVSKGSQDASSQNRVVAFLNFGEVPLSFLRTFRT